MVRGPGVENGRSEHEVSTVHLLSVIYSGWILLSDVSRFPVPRLFPSLSTPYSRLVSRRRGEGSTNEERDDRDETRNTGDDQGSVCKVGTQDPENLDEELKPLVTVWSRLYPSSVTRVLRSSFTPSTRAGGGPSRNVERRGTRRYERNGVEEVNGILSLMSYLLTLSPHIISLPPARRDRAGGTEVR